MSNTSSEGAGLRESLREQVGDAEYAVLRLYGGELLDIKVRDWEKHKRQYPEASAMEVARGLSRVDAANLTLLGNKQRNVENEDG